MYNFPENDGQAVIHTEPHTLPPSQPPSVIDNNANKLK